MRALAEYIMRGRVQAILIAILGVPLISHAALALVTLRRGAWEGISLLMWAFLPVLMLLWSDFQYMPLAFASLGMLAAVYLGAMLLRLNVSWSITGLAVVGFSILLGVLWLRFFDQHLTAFLQQVLELHKANLTAQGREIDDTLMIVPETKDIVGILVAGIAGNCVLVLVTGRWWQALLFNPGGFRQEFYQLRMNRLTASACAAVLLLCGLSSDYQLWSWVVALPLVMVSIAVAHQFAAVQRMGLTWLVIFYIALFNFPFYLAMAALGLVDSWMDLRKSLLPKTGNKPGNKDHRQDD